MSSPSKSVDSAATVRRVTVHVTQEDILNGEPSSAPSCPLALALCRALDLEYLSVANDKFWLDDGKGRPLPEKACSFYHAFDADRPVKPFSFELEVPPAISQTDISTPSKDQNNG